MRGRRGAWRHRRPFCVAGVAFRDIDLYFAWQAWCLATSMCILRDRCGTDGTLALVARLGPVWRRCRRGCLSSRSGAWRHRPSLCVVAVVLGDTLSHTTLSHTTLSHTHTQLFHTHLFHTQSFTHGFVTYNSFTHNTFIYTNLHTHTHTCSETSYRITDVECITRAQTTH